MSVEKYRMDFNEEVFNALMTHLNKYSDNTLLHKIKHYSTIEEENGEKYISVRFFGSELRRLCWLLIDFLPVESDKNNFSLQIEEIIEREIAYQKRKEEEHHALYEGIKKELLLNPSIQGAEIAKTLNVRRDQVYSIWHDVKKEIANEKENG